MNAALLTTTLCILALLLVAVNSDQNYYKETNAEADSRVVEDLLSIPACNIEVQTSRVYLAGTSHQISMFLVGEFSVSGPHMIGPFTEGQKSIFPISLTRKIGELIAVEFHAGGTDGWLLQRMTVHMGNKFYLPEVQKQWLDRLDPGNEQNYPSNNLLSENIDAWEPLQSEDPSFIPVGSKLRIKVVDSYFNYAVDAVKPFTQL